MVEEVVKKKKEVYPGNSESLPFDLEKKFSDDELEEIFSNLGAIQLTFGCSKGCPFCGFDAIPGVRESIDYARLANLFKKYGKYLGNSEPFLYWASEPSDYECEDKTYDDVHQLAREYADYDPYISSRKADDKRWLSYLTNLESETRISVFGLDKEEIQQIEETIKKAATAKQKQFPYVKVDIYGKSKSHVRGIGKSHREVKGKEIDNEGYGIGCFNGVLLTPRGIYNIVQIPISEEFPQGQVVIPLEKLSKGEIKSGDHLKNVLKDHLVEHYFASFGSKSVKETGLGRIIIERGGDDFFVYFDDKGVIKETLEVNFSDAGRFIKDAFLGINDDVIDIEMGTNIDTKEYEFFKKQVEENLPKIPLKINPKGVTGNGVHWEQDIFLPEVYDSGHITIKMTYDIRHGKTFLHIYLNGKSEEVSR